MSIRTRAVRVHQIPERVTTRSEKVFLRHLQNCAQSERPRYVLDCSRVWTMNRATIHLLLSCLEEAMKCNGDVRLASLHPEAEAALRATDVSRLFEIYPTSEGAVNSFHQRATSIAPYSSQTEAFDQDAKHAA